MRKRFVKHGNSVALIIERPIMELLHMAVDSEVEISTDGTRLIIEPVLRDAHRAEIETAIEHGRTRYGRMLKHLGE